MNEGRQLIIMNAMMATMLMDVCVFYGGRRCGGVAFFAAKRTSSGNMATVALQTRRYAFGASISWRTKSGGSIFVASIFWRRE